MPKIAISMSGFQVLLWEIKMIAMGRITDERDIPALLGISRQAYWNMKKHGADRRTNLACQALLHGLAPWAYIKGNE